MQCSKHWGFGDEPLTEVLCSHRADILVGKQINKIHHYNYKVIKDVISGGEKGYKASKRHWHVRE